ncbi:MAG: alkaline phosphatase [Bacteroidales bacterium]|nr:alkaline phosphatase [Bacteroidales bacterium]
MKKICFALIFFSLLFSNAFAQKKAKNVILLIGDGTGLTQLYASYEANNRNLNIYSMPHTALSITNCYDKKVTDSGAGGTAIAIGKKTHYRGIGVDAEDNPSLSLLEIAKQKGKHTGILVSCDLCHATPASFIAHVKDRDSVEDIAEFYLTEHCDIFMGGGKMRFDQRKDNRNLIDSLRDKGYEVVFSEAEMLNTKSQKIAGMFADNYMPIYKERGDILQKALALTLERLDKNNKKGFFLMFEGSQIDSYAHNNDFETMLGEIKDFDECVRIALEFAKKDKNTLVVVTADHETGGLTLVADGNNDKPHFSTGGHTAAPVIIYAYGPGSENFHGVIQNNETFDLILKSMK